MKTSRTAVDPWYFKVKDADEDKRCNQKLLHHNSFLR